MCANGTKGTIHEVCVCAAKCVARERMPIHRNKLRRSRVAERAEQHASLRTRREYALYETCEAEESRACGQEARIVLREVAQAQERQVRRKKVLFQVCRARGGIGYARRA